MCQKLVSGRAPCCYAWRENRASGVVKESWSIRVCYELRKESFDEIEGTWFLFTALVCIRGGFSYDYLILSDLRKWRLTGLACGCGEYAR